MTNGDVIRTMSDDNIISFLNSIYIGYCYCEDGTALDMCNGMPLTIEWLNKEAGEEFAKLSDKSLYNRCSFYDSEYDECVLGCTDAFCDSPNVWIVDDDLYE